MSLENESVPVTSSAEASPDAVTPSQTTPQQTQHEIVKETPATPKPAAKMEDTIRARFRELNKPAEAVRGTDGKFQKPADLAGKTVNEPAAEPVVPEPAEEIAAEAVEKPVEAPPPPSDPEIAKAPSSWKKEAQAKWDAADPDIRKEVIRREADFHKGLEAYKGWAKVGQDLDSEIRPYEAMIRAAGATPQAIIKDVFNTIYQLKTGSPEQKAAVALNILNEYGVDLEAVSSAAEKVAAGQPAADPHVLQLQQQLDATNKRIEEQAQASLRREFAEVVQEAEAFKKAAGHEHYDTVKFEMAAFIESGVCSTMQEAYDKAIWANDTVRAQLQAKQQEDKRKQAADKAAAAKKAASTNVVPRGTLPATPKVGTMEDTIRGKLREINSRG